MAKYQLRCLNIPNHVDNKVDKFRCDCKSLTDAVRKLKSLICIWDRVDLIVIDPKEPKQ
jgi:hypothetical protein